MTIKQVRDEVEAIKQYIRDGEKETAAFLTVRLRWAVLKEIAESCPGWAGKYAESVLSLDNDMREADGTFLLGPDHLKDEIGGVLVNGSWAD